MSTPPRPELAAVRAALGVTGDSRPGSIGESVDSGAGWVPLLATGVLGGAVLAQGVVVLLAGRIGASLGVSTGSVGRALSLWSIGVVLGSPLALRCGMWRGRHLLTAATGALSAVALGWAALATSRGMVQAAAVAGGVSAVVAGALHRSLLSDRYPGLALVHVITAYGATAIGFASAGIVVCAPLADALGLSWRVGLLALCVIAAGAAVLLAGVGGTDVEWHEPRRLARASGLPPEDEPRRPGFVEALRRCYTVPSVRPLLAITAAAGALGFGAAVFGSYLLIERHGVPEATAMLAVAGSGAVAVLTLLAGGSQAAAGFRADPARLLDVATAGLLVSAAALVGLATSPVAWLAAGALLVCPAGVVAATVAVDRVLAGALPPELRGTAGAITASYATVLGVGAGGAALTAVDGRLGLSWALALLGVVAAGAAGVARVAQRSASADVGRAVAAVVERAELGAQRRTGERLPLLSARDIDFSYGPLQILFGVDFQVDEGEMVALLGTNGAGKSTLLRVLSGLGTPTGGAVRWRGEDITYADPADRVRLGITQIPGGKAVFGPLSVAENLRLYGYALGRNRRAVEAGIDEGMSAFPRLAERRNAPASTLSGGEQQMLALTKALILRPQLLLIDELSLGLAPKVVGELLEMVRAINAAGTAVVLVEQSVNVALSLAERAYFMEKGEVRFEGATADLLERPDVLRSVFLAGAAS